MSCVVLRKLRVSCLIKYLKYFKGDLLNNKLATPRLRELDFLRGLAVLAVIAVHVGQNFPTEIGLFDSGASYGRFGVQLFYFVSALTMCFMWEARGKESGRVRKFYMRRFFRIAPLFWLAIPFYLAIYGVGESYWAPEGIGIRQIALTAIFLHGFFPDSINSVVPGGWSIAVEMTFYLFFPLLVMSIGGRRLVYLALSVLVWFFYAVFIRGWLEGVLGGGVLVKDFLYLNFVNQAPIFLLGCYLYYALRDGVGGRDILLLILWVILGFGSKKLAGVEGVGFVYMYMLMAMGVYFCMRAGVKLSIVERLGKRSYAMYLCHFSVISLFSKFEPPLGGFARFVLAFFVISAAAYFVAGFLGKLIEDRVHSWVSRRLNAGAGGRSRSKV